MISPTQYLYYVIAFVLLFVFLKIGLADDEIGWILGLAAGFLALILNHYWPGGYGGLALHAFTAFALLTAYKIIQGHRQTRNYDQEDDGEFPGRGP